MVKTTRRPDTPDQLWIMGELHKGRQILPVTVRRGSNRVRRLGFSEREPVNLHSLKGLAERGRIVIRDGEIVTQEARSAGRATGSE